MNLLRLLIKRIRKKKVFSEQNPVVNAESSELEVNNWAVSEHVIYDLVPVVGVHPYPINELCLMAATVCALQPTHIFEWGTNLGKSARIFYETAKRFNVSTKIVSIDLPDSVDHIEHPHKNRGIYVKNIDAVTLLQGDGIDTSLNLYLDNNRRKSVRPLFFIDGDHSYDSVNRELIRIHSTAPNASILLHDTFYQSPDAGYNIGPYKAIKDFLKYASDEYKKLSQNIGLPGMTLLYKK